MMYGVTKGRVSGCRMPSFRTRNATFYNIKDNIVFINNIHRRIFKKGFAIAKAKRHTMRNIALKNLFLYRLKLNHLNFVFSINFTTFAEYTYKTLKNNTFK